MVSVERAASLSVSDNSGTSGPAIGPHGRPKVRAVPDPPTAVLSWLMAPGLASSCRRSMRSYGGPLDGVGDMCRECPSRFSFLPRDRRQPWPGPYAQPAKGRQRHDGILGRNVAARTPTPWPGGVTTTRLQLPAKPRCISTPNFYRTQLNDSH